MRIGFVFERVNQRVEGELARVEEWAAGTDAFLTRGRWRQPVLFAVLVVLLVVLSVLEGHSLGDVFSNLLQCALIVVLASVLRWALKRAGSRRRGLRPQP